MSLYAPNSGGGNTILPPFTDPSTLPMPPGSVAGQSVTHETGTILPTSGPAPLAMSPTHAGRTPGNPPINLPKLPPPPLCTTQVVTQVLFEGSAVASPVDDCMRSVSVFGFSEEIFGPVPPTATLNVFVNGVPRGSVIGSLITFPIILDPFGGITEYISLIVAEVPLTGCSLNASDLVQSSITIGGLTSPLSTGVRVESHVKYSCLTQHYDNARTGWYQYESQLNKALLKQTGANAFKQQFQLPVDGKVYAQPLYMHHVNFPGLGAKNVVYLATENDSVFAYDADDPNAVLLWQRSLLQPGERAVVLADVFNCTDITPTIGVSSTPVIDCGCIPACCGSNCGCDTDCCCGAPSSIVTCCAQTMYVVSYSARDAVVGGNTVTTFHFYLHALDIITGTERANSPVEVGGQVNGNGEGSVNGLLAFVPQLHNSRPGLLLQNGCIYMTFSAHCDQGQWHGWVFAYDAKTFKRRGIFCTTPDNWGAGVWQSNTGLAGDGEAIYCTTGNGDVFDADTGGTCFSNTVLKLAANLRVLSWFSPADQAFLNDNATSNDMDLASGGILILPGLQLGAHPNLLVTCGKDGNVMLLDRDALGGFAGDANPFGTLGLNPNAVSTLPLDDKYSNITGKSDNSPGPWGAPAYYNGVDGQRIFYCGNGSSTASNTAGNGHLLAFTVKSGVLSRLPTNASPIVTSDQFRTMGTTPVVSSNNQVKDSAIVWAVNRGTVNVLTPTPTPITLMAYDATNLGAALNPPGGWPIGTWGTVGRAFIEPLVMNGKVYVASADHVGVFYCANETKVF